MRRAPRRPAGRRACARRMCVLRRSGRGGLISSPVENVLYQLVFSFVRAFCVTCQLITCKVCSRARISIGITFNHVKGGLQSTRTDLGRTSVPRERDTSVRTRGLWAAMRRSGSDAAVQATRRVWRPVCVLRGAVAFRGRAAMGGADAGGGSTSAPSRRPRWHLGG